MKQYIFESSTNPRYADNVKFVGRKCTVTYFHDYEMGMLRALIDFQTDPNGPESWIKTSLIKVAPRTRDGKLVIQTINSQYVLAEIK